MIPILFEADAKDFSTRGLGPLSDAKSCKVVEERNGTYELIMQYPKTGIHFEDIALNRIVLAIPSPYRDAQPFRIYKVSTPMNGIVTINAQHISYDLSGVAVMPFSGVSVSDVLNKIKLNSVNTNDFTFSGNSDFSTECNYIIPHTARQILGGIEGSVIDKFGGEYEFDRFNVKWYLNRGSNKGVTIRYGKNLLTLNQDVDVSKIVTGVIPYWVDSENTIAVIGDRVDLEGEYTFSKIIPLDLSQEYEEEPTKEQLNSRANSYIKANYSLEPEINCTVSFALIEQYEEYKDYRLLEQCDLCDTVTVQYPDLGVKSTAKIVKIDTDVLRGRYNSVTIGSVRANIAQTIVAQQKAVESVPTRTDVSQLLRNSLDKVMGAQGGTVRFLDTNDDGEPDTLYIADNADPALAQRVWRFNYLGWAASSNGYNGPFTLGATLEDGLLADFVTAANLTAGTIRSADNGRTFYLDLLNGVLNMSATSLSIGGRSVDSIAGSAASSAANSAVNNFVNSVYNPETADIQKQLDGKIETYYYDYEPKLNNIPASQWTTDTLKTNHEGDLFFDKSTGYSYRFYKNGSTWEWQQVKDKDIEDALTEAGNAKDTADQKRRVFVSQPVPPYDVGDLWVQGNNPTSGDIMRCQIGRQSGDFSSGDWIKACNYTDDSGLEAFIVGEFAKSIDAAKRQADAKAETWYQSSDPSTNWSDTQKAEHKGDLWYNSSSNVQKYYRWDGSNWEELKSTPPDAVFDRIDGKAQVFVDTPYTPYHKGDLWFESASSDILTCTTERLNGDFNRGDWVKRNKYTGDESLNDFVSSVYNPKIEELQGQIDGQIETWFYDYDPTVNNYPASEWSTEQERLNHQGDLFYNKLTGKSYRFFKNDAGWEWSLVVDSDVALALQKASEAKDTADSKRRVFITQPVPPYDTGDLWAQGPNGGLMRCKSSRQSGGYSASDWEKASDYIDRSAAESVSAEALRAFAEGEFASTIKDVRQQVDQKAESWYQSTDPSKSWSGDEQAIHKGDIWRVPGEETAKQWDGSKWIDMTTNPPSAVFDEIDGKAEIWASQPIPPYHVNDLWFGGTSSDIKICTKTRESGVFVNGDWIKYDKYIDKESANESAQNAVNGLTQKDIFDKLTDGGKLQGLFMRDGKLYINAAYIGAGTLASADGRSFTLNLETGEIKAERLSWASEYSTMSEDGKLNCTGAVIDGELNVNTGKLPSYTNTSSGVNIGRYKYGAIYYQEDKAANNTFWNITTNAGVYFGMDTCLLDDLIQKINSSTNPSNVSFGLEPTAYVTRYGSTGATVFGKSYLQLSSSETVGVVVDGTFEIIANNIFVQNKSANNWGNAYQGTVWIGNKGLHFCNGILIGVTD